VAVNEPTVVLIGRRLTTDQVPHLQEAADAARGNLQRAIDLVILHETCRVAGQEAAAALNEPTVLLAVATWERFIGDLLVLANRSGWRGSGRHPSTVAGANLVRPRRTVETAGPDETLPGDAACVLAGLTGGWTPLSRLRARVIYDWRGATPRFVDMTGFGLRDQRYHRPAYPAEPWEHLTIGEVVYQSLKLRSAIAHSYVPRMGDVPSPRRGRTTLTPEDAHWLNAPSQMFWHSDKKDGLSVQAGCARGVLALFIQLIDQCILMLAGALADPQDRAELLRYRLPGEWFTTTYPASSRRGLEQDVHLWRAKRLSRPGINDIWPS
jgi:hypothetical protein